MSNNHGNGEKETRWLLPRRPVNWGYSTPEDQLAWYISTWREINQQTQEQLAVMSGLSLPLIRAIEQEEANPTIPGLERMAAAMGTSLDIHLTPISAATTYILPEQGTAASIPQYIRDWRVLNHVSVWTLSTLTGITEYNIRRIELGKTVLTLAMLERIATAMQATVCFVFIPIGEEKWS